jgi:hypothetical protein
VSRSESIAKPDNYPSPAQVARDKAQVKAWLKKNKPTICAPMHCDWSIAMLIPYDAMPGHKRPGRPAKS